MKRLAPALLLALLLPAAHAETLVVPLGAQGQTGLPMPHPGETRRAVLERFGLADEEHPPVGRPPITRWDYREFSVYFEGERVIDSVQHFTPHSQEP